MPFVSYAQNLEDVLLWRALQHVENGFYMDVGASDPAEDSVTKAFYDRGWHGINIEPVPEYHSRLVNSRLRDISLAIAAGQTDGELVLFDVPSIRGLATADENIAARYRDQGLEVVTLTVPVRRLARICEEFVAEEIHFLKIDVEGAEAEVLGGMDLQRWRPWIVLVEATVPNSQTASFEDWEPGLLGSGYRFAYFDGLNRYYVAEERADLLPMLSIQPNVFDDFVTSGQVAASAAAEGLKLRAQEAEAQLAAVYSSTSWRITRPLRWARRRVRS